MSMFEDWQDRVDRTWANAGSLVQRLDRPQKRTEPDGCVSTVTAVAVHADGVRVAFVETKELETTPGVWDVSHTLRVLLDGAVSLEWVLPTYNPFFGCDVAYLAWHEGHIVVVYEEKHHVVLASFDAQSGAPGRLLPINHDCTLTDAAAYFVGDEPGLIEAARLPHLDLVAPLPISDGVPVLRCRPKPAVSSDEFSLQVAAELFGDAPPQPYADLLVGACAFRFWDTWPEPTTEYGFPMRWNSPYWLPYYYSQSLGEQAQSEFVGMLDRLSQEVRGEVACEPHVQAADHVRRQAATWANACRDGELPGGALCAFWAEWSQPKFRRDLSSFPSGFRDAYEVVADRRSGPLRRLGRWLRGM